MSVAYLSWAWSQSLPATAKLVLLALADHADAEGRCWPSLTTLEIKTGLARSSVARLITQLESLGLLERSRSVGGTGRSTVYTLKQSHSATVKQSQDETIKQSHGETVPQRNSPTVRRNSPTVRHKQSHSRTRTVKNHQEPSKRKIFKPPTVEEVAEYVATRQIKIDPQAFVDHYTANGWMRGKSKIKDWQACVRTWERNQKQTANTQCRKKESIDAYL